MKNDQRWHKKLWPTLRLVAPGTVFREGLENILRAKTGGLIVIGDNERVRAITEGGFMINDVMTAAHLYELAKMDGAIILDEQCSTIWRANAHLQPALNDTDEETGIRHRVATCVATQTDAIVIAISQRRSIITVYGRGEKFVLMDVEALLVRANQALQTLERYCSEIKKEFDNLSLLEFDGIVSVFDFVKVVQLGELVERIIDEIEFYLLQLGAEGRLSSLQKDELSKDIIPECHNVLLDYAPDSGKKTVGDIERALAQLDDNDIMDRNLVARLFGYSGSDVLEKSVAPRGYRILGRIPRLPFPVIQNIIRDFEGDFQRILAASVEQLDDVEGIGAVRSQAIHRGLRRQRDYAELNGHNRL